MVGKYHQAKEEVRYMEEAVLEAKQVVEQCSLKYKKRVKRVEQAMKAKEEAWERERAELRGDN